MQVFGKAFIKGLGFSTAVSVFLSLSILLAQTIATFSPGDLLSSSQINANFQIAAPEGFVGAFAVRAVTEPLDPEPKPGRATSR